MLIFATFMIIYVQEVITRTDGQPKTIVRNLTVLIIIIFRYKYQKI
jgi:hypothetical protein